MSKSKALSRITKWERAGKKVEAMTAQEAIVQGGLDFEVKVSSDPVGVKIYNQYELTMGDKYMTYGETKKGHLFPLGVVGNRYTPIQNADAFDFLNNIVDESGANFHSAGVLDGGARCWINMKLPTTLEIGSKQDALEPYLTCVNSHDGSSSFRVFVSYVRIVCTNGLRMRVADAESELVLRHTASSTLKVQEARDSLNLVFKYQESFEKEVQQLLNTKMTDAQYKKFVETLIPEPKKDASQRKVNSVENVRSELLGLWKAPTQQIVAGTAWAAYNAVTEYVDWFKPVRGGEEKDAIRAERSLFNESRLANRAHDLLLSI